MQAFDSIASRLGDGTLTVDAAIAEGREQVAGLAEEAQKKSASMYIQILEKVRHSNASNRIRT